jgi:hypothetical protein
MWFLGCLHRFLTERESGTGRLASLAFVAGITGYALNIVGQAPQITLTLPAQAAGDASSSAMLTDLGYVMLVIANIPLAVMFAAIALVTFRSGAFPRWLGWLAAFAGAAAATLPFAVMAPNGPLSPQGWLSYALYLAPVAWLIPATTIMIRTSAPQPQVADGHPRPQLPHSAAPMK